MANKGKGKERDTSDDPNKPHDKKDGEDQNEDEEKDKVGDKDGKFNTFSKKLASAFKKKPTSPFPASTSFQGLSSYTAAGPSGVSKFKSRRRRTRSEASTSSSFSAPEIKPEAYEGVGGGGLQPREGLTLGRQVGQSFLDFDGKSPSEKGALQSPLKENTSPSPSGSSADQSPRLPNFGLPPLFFFKTKTNRSTSDLLSSSQQQQPDRGPRRQASDEPFIPYRPPRPEQSPETPSTVGSAFSAPGFGPPRRVEITELPPTMRSLFPRSATFPTLPPPAQTPLDGRHPYAGETPRTEPRQTRSTRPSTADPLPRATGTHSSRSRADLTSLGQTAPSTLSMTSLHASSVPLRPERRRVSPATSSITTSRTSSHPSSRNVSASSSGSPPVYYQPLRDRDQSPSSTATTSPNFAYRPLPPQPMLILRPPVQQAGSQSSERLVGSLSSSRSPPGDPSLSLRSVRPANSPPAETTIRPAETRPGNPPPRQVQRQGFGPPGPVSSAKPLNIVRTTPPRPPLPPPQRPLPGLPNRPPPLPSRPPPPHPAPLIPLPQPPRPVHGGQQTTRQFAFDPFDPTTFPDALQPTSERSHQREVSAETITQARLRQGEPVPETPQIDATVTFPSLAIEPPTPATLPVNTPPAGDGIGLSPSATRAPSQLVSRRRRQTESDIEEETPVDVSVLDFAIGYNAEEREDRAQRERSLSQRSMVEPIAAVETSPRSTPGPSTSPIAEASSSLSPPPLSTSPQASPSAIVSPTDTDRSSSSPTSSKKELKKAVSPSESEERESGGDESGSDMEEEMERAVEIRANQRRMNAKLAKMGMGKEDVAAGPVLNTKSSRWKLGKFGMTSKKSKGKGKEKEGNPTDNKGAFDRSRENLSQMATLQSDATRERWDRQTSKLARMGIGPGNELPLPIRPGMKVSSSSKGLSSSTSLLLGPAFRSRNLGESSVDPVRSTPPSTTPITIPSMPALPQIPALPPLDIPSEYTSPPGSLRDEGDLHFQTESDRDSSRSSLASRRQPPPPLTSLPPRQQRLEGHVRDDASTPTAARPTTDQTTPRAIPQGSSRTSSQSSASQGGSQSTRSSGSSDQPLIPPTMMYTALTHTPALDSPHGHRPSFHSAPPSYARPMISSQSSSSRPLAQPALSASTSSRSLSDISFRSSTSINIPTRREAVSPYPNGLIVGGTIPSLYPFLTHARLARSGWCLESPVYAPRRFGVEYLNAHFWTRYAVLIEEAVHNGQFAPHTTLESLFAPGSVAHEQIEPISEPQRTRRAGRFRAFFSRQQPEPEVVVYHRPEYADDYLQSRNRYTVADPSTLVRVRPTREPVVNLFDDDDMIGLEDDEPVNAPDQASLSGSTEEASRAAEEDTRRKAVERQILEELENDLNGTGPRPDDEQEFNTEALISDRRDPETELTQDLGDITSLERRINSQSITTTTLPSAEQPEEGVIGQLVPPTPSHESEVEAGTGELEEPKQLDETDLVTLTSLPEPSLHYPPGFDPRPLRARLLAFQLFEAVHDYRQSLKDASTSSTTGDAGQSSDSSGHTVLPDHRLRRSQPIGRSTMYASPTTVRIELLANAVQPVVLTIRPPLARSRSAPNLDPLHILSRRESDYQRLREMLSGSTIFWHIPNPQTPNQPSRDVGGRPFIMAQVRQRPRPHSVAPSISITLPDNIARSTIRDSAQTNQSLSLVSPSVAAFPNLGQVGSTTVDSQSMRRTRWEAQGESSGRAFQEASQDAGRVERSTGGSDRDSQESAHKGDSDTERRVENEGSSREIS